LLDETESVAFGSALARKVGVVFQRPERQLFEPTVWEDISFVLRRFSDLDDAGIHRRVREASAMVGLDIEAIGRRPPASLTDGNRRKAAIAGILVNRPDVLILDEPAVGLDPTALEDIVRLIQEFKKDGKTIVVVSHDMEPFLAILDVLMALHGGKQAAFGTPADVCSALAMDDAMKGLLPGLGVLIRELRDKGCAMPENEFRVPALVHRLKTLRGQCGSS
jgi:energy-coupling factor transporter ATP-binding protein EcfA2